VILIFKKWLLDSFKNAFRVCERLERERMEKMVNSNKNDALVSINGLWDVRDDEGKQLDLEEAIFDHCREKDENLLALSLKDKEDGIKNDDGISNSSRGKGNGNRGRDKGSSKGKGNKDSHNLNSKGGGKYDNSKGSSNSLTRTNFSTTSGGTSTSNQVDCTNYYQELHKFPNLSKFYKKFGRAFPAAWGKDEAAIAERVKGRSSNSNCLLLML